MSSAGGTYQGRDTYDDSGIVFFWCLAMGLGGSGVHFR